MKCKFYSEKAAVLAVVFLLMQSGIVYAKGEEGACFYFGRIPVLDQEEETEKSVTSDDRDLTDGSSYHHWNIGDTVLREIDGQEYRFRCIDQNYWDQEENHRQCALFLCDSVIPADFGSKYAWEVLEDGSHGYVFHAGPVTFFGESNEYKYSYVRDWLSQAAETEFSMAEPVQTGVTQAYTGSTGTGLYEQLQASDLKAAEIGSQKMNDRLFILSVDEALRYRNWLWRFEGAEEKNPWTQINEYCKGYWLRNPAGVSGNYDTDRVYVVDLVQGNIRPELVHAAEDENDGSEGRAGTAQEDEELKNTGTIGVRPVFALAQDRE
jgi:hypothetical protein